MTILIINAHLAYPGWSEGKLNRTFMDHAKSFFAEHGHHGTGGKMQGKKFMVSTTWNAPKEAFNNSDGILYGGKGSADLFLHITSNYKFMGYEILPDYGVFNIFKDPDIPRALKDYRRHLEKYSL